MFPIEFQVTRSITARLYLRSFHSCVNMNAPRPWIIHLIIFAGHMVNYQDQTAAWSSSQKLSTQYLNTFLLDGYQIYYSGCFKE